MATTIPDLWSDDIKVDILSPLAILRTQVGFLEQKTQGILRAQVATTSTDVWLQHQLDLIAPALSHYRVTLLTAQHGRPDFYPVMVRAGCFAPKPRTPAQAAVAGMPGSQPADQRVAATQAEFIDLV